MPYLETGYVLRSGFSRQEPVSDPDALRRTLPAAAEWLAGTRNDDVPPGTLAGAEGVERLADQVEAGLPDGIRAHLTYFAIRAGARRLADASACLSSLGLAAAASVADTQARLVGSLQYPITTGDTRTAAATLRRLAPTYAELAKEL